LKTKRCPDPENQEADGVGNPPEVCAGNHSEFKYRIGKVVEENKRVNTEHKCRYQTGEDDESLIFKKQGWQSKQGKQREGGNGNESAGDKEHLGFFKHCKNR